MLKRGQLKGVNLLKCTGDPVLDGTVDMLTRKPEIRIYIIYMDII